MQLKLLNFHKMISQFASNIVGAFISLIIYQSTNSIFLAFLYLALSFALRMLFAKILLKKLAKKPQIFLVLRIFPFLIYSLSILLLDTNMQLLGIILVLFFDALSSTFRDLPLDFIFNYSTYGKGASSNGTTRVFDYGGVILAIILGGLFLDYLDKWVVIVISCVSYMISVFPLLAYYIKQKNSSGFNQEEISNAIESFKNVKIKKHQQNIITKKLMTKYFFIYFAFCVYDALMPVFSLFLFLNSAESYSFVSYIQASFYAFFGLGSYIAGILDERKDLTASIIFCCIISGTLVCLLPFLINFIWIEIVLFAIIGFLYAFISIFCYSRMMTRCKIMGVSNLALLQRQLGSCSSQIVVYGFCFAGTFMFVPAFFLIGIVFATCAYFIPSNEEKTRKMLVDYLQNNKLY